MEADLAVKGESIYTIMKRLLAVLLVALLISPAWAAGYPYESWTTPILQQKRVELYKTLPVRGNRKGVTAFAKWSEPLPQEVEIKKIEQELDRRRSAGDKGAYYEPAAPQYPRRHKNPEG